MNHSGAVRSIAFVPFDGAEAVVSVGDDGFLRMWEVAAGRQLGSVRLSEKGLLSVATTVIEGRALAIVGGSGSLDGGFAHELFVYDLAAWKPKFEPVRRNELPVAVVVATCRAGQPVAFTRSAADYAIDGDGAYGYGGIVLGWDLLTGEAIGKPLEIEQLGCLAAAADGRLLVTSHASAYVVEGDTLGEAFEGHLDDDRMIMDAVFGVLGGRPIAVTADPFSVWVWDPSTREAIGEALYRGAPTSAAPIRKLALAADGRLVLARFGEAGIEIWDLERRVKVREERGEATAIACSGSAIAVGRPDGSLELRPPAPRGVSSTWSLA